MGVGVGPLFLHTIGGPPIGVPDDYIHYPQKVTGKQNIAIRYILLLA